MSEGEAWLRLAEFAEEHERVTIYRDDDTNEWYIEWFNLKGGFQYVSGKDPLELVEVL